MASIETVHTEIRGVKEDILPRIEAKIDDIQLETKKTNGSVAAVTMRVNELEAWRATHDKEMAVRKEYKQKEEQTKGEYFRFWLKIAGGLIILAASLYLTGKGSAL